VLSAHHTYHTSVAVHKLTALMCNVTQGRGASACLIMMQQPQHMFRSHCTKLRFILHHLEGPGWLCASVCTTDFGLCCSGEYRMVAYSTGGIAIHATMVPNTSLILTYGRPQDPSLAPQPGMSISYAPNVEWPSSLVDTATGGPASTSCPPSLLPFMCSTTAACCHAC
jgi:hypothetical protein